MNYKLNLAPEILNRFDYKIPTQDKVKKPTPEEKAKQEISKIEEEALLKGWTKELLWKTGAKNYLDMTPYEYLSRGEGLSVYEVTEEHICIHIWNDQYAFFTETNC